MNRVILFNTSIMTGGEGTYCLSKVSVEKFNEIWHWHGHEKVSAIGHEATAEVVSTILGEKIPVNRVAIKQEVGDIALVLKMKGRIPEGTVLTDPKELEKIGYELFKLEKKMDIVLERFEDQMAYDLRHANFSEEEIERFLRENKK